MSKPERYISLIVGPNCETESFAIRSTLEYFGARVTLHLVGRPNDLIDVLNGKDLDEKVDYVILNFHGDDGRFCMPELGDDVYEEDEPRGEFFNAEDVKRYAKLNDTHIIASGCTLGEEELANAFLSCGCKSYIGPDDYIDGNANLIFVLRFMYERIQNKKSEQEAFELATSIDEETFMYKRYVR
ncbi:delta-aminolevulinic acid dehydratase [Priestia taiwanensis]|uniref:Delta-aminolevulinic acid dehydratase n=1 Tax=Priestia taiwanensis TaxID=1347902 RepID=A0A917AST3_9BACI|nr:delta-aminolevulinic acid dehydratase [Priestia taiwanensis]MBM7363932.1 hypothetical protein [Priestia taiwanensis]GGE70247.1 hypothetical protein GCM10007140_20230 [Priestia taiwanensis]